MNSELRKKLIGTFSWKRPFYSVGFIYLFFLFATMLFANKLIFPVPTPSYSKNDEWVRLIKTTKEEQVACFYTKAKAGKPTLLWSHGNGEELGKLTKFLPYFAQEGFGIFAYDYLGYGLSDGKPTENGCYRSIEAAYSHLTKNLNVKPNSIIIFGQSVGSGPSVWLSQNAEHAGMILVSPFKSTFTTVTRIPIFPNDKFPNLKRIKNYQQPLLIIHGAEDSIISFSHGQALFDASQSEDKRLLAIEDAGHNDIYPVGLDLILKEINTFTDRAVAK